RVFIDAVQAYERIEHEEARGEPLSGVAQPALVLSLVQTEARSGDHVEVEWIELDAGGAADPFQPFTDEVRGVFGGVQEHAPWARDREVAQARGPRGHGDRHVESEKRLAALGLAADDPDGFGPPQIFDQPAPFEG